MTFKVGDRVEWTSQAGGWTRTKVGEVIEVVPPGRNPTGVRNPGMYRDHESYVVRAVAKGRRSGEHKATYWPRAASLRLAPTQTETTQIESLRARLAAAESARDEAQRRAGELEGALRELARGWDGRTDR